MENNKLFILLLLVFWGCNNNHKENSTDWKVYKADAKSTSYSPLKRINKNNVSNLKVAWKFHTKDAPKGAKSSINESSPIVVNNVMYVTSPWLKVYALNASTGKEIWSFDPFNGKQRGGILRSVVYWDDNGDSGGRILFTAGHYLFALNAKNGKLIKSFGNDGRVNLNVGLERNPKSISVGASSPGTVFKNLLILGSTVGEGYGSPPGYVRAYNIRTGDLEWTFHTIPKPGEFGYKTWPKDAWKYTGGVNDWAGMSLDKKRGMVFLALGSPVYDYYGADRRGKNLFANCIVALNAKNGKLIWYYQTVHHDLWDYDLPAPPNLVTINKNGKNIDAVAQVTKTGFVFVLNRVTGKPIFPVEEKKVPTSDVKGEESWPTQPFPLKPKPFAKQKFTKDDINNITKEGYLSILKKIESLRSQGIFTPPSFKGTLEIPATRGGADWGGAAYDPRTNILYVNGNNLPSLNKLSKRKKVNKSLLKTAYERGKLIYRNNCAACHGIDRKGEGGFPSLISLNERMTEEQVTHQIKNGGGRMPAYKKMSDKKLHELLSYLFDKRNSKSMDNLKNKDEGKDDINSSKYNYPKYLSLTANSIFKGPSGYPVIKPPWGTLNAINLNTGKYEWSIPLGIHPELKGKVDDIHTGTKNLGGPIVTAGGLVFIGATTDNMFRAFDKDNGKLLWKTTLTGRGRAAPITYMSHGKQFVVITLSGQDTGKAQDTIVAFSLPK